MLKRNGSERVDCEIKIGRQCGRIKYDEDADYVYYWMPNDKTKYLAADVHSAFTDIWNALTTEDKSVV
jgi:hypothetical protein